MLRQILHFFTVTINPIAIYREEKRLQRELFMEIVREVCDTLKSQSEVMLQHGKIVERFVKSFEVTGEPNSYTIRDEDEVKDATQRFNLDANEFGEFDPFRVIQ